MFKMLYPVLDGNGDIHKATTKLAMSKVQKTAHSYLTILGIAMKRKVLYLVKWQENSIPLGALAANSFLRDVHALIQANPKFESQIEIDLLKHSIAKQKGAKKGGAGTHLQQPTRMLLTALYQKSPISYRFLTSNINSLNVRTQTRRKALITREINQTQGCSFISKTEFEAVSQIVNYVINRYLVRVMSKREIHNELFN